MNYINERTELLIDLALKEDFDTVGDITSDSTIPSEQVGNAELISKANGIICGLELFIKVFHMIDKNIEFKTYFKDGDLISKKDKILDIKGSLNSILKAERTALNFIQRMSGIATFSHTLAEIVKGSKTQILDTRKTLPAYRELDKYSVKTGGSSNHRIGLFDMFMIKDNHIEAAGSIKEAVKRANEYKKQKNLSAKIEVEVKDTKELLEAIEAKADVIMLDNMDNEQVKECIDITNGRAKLEVSGNVTEERVRELANYGVDYISLGALTHSVKAFDISLLVK